MEGLEPTRLAAPDPKSGTSTNFATSACKAACLLLSLQPFEGVVVKACKDKGIHKLIKARIGVSEPAFEQRIKILRKA